MKKVKRGYNRRKRRYTYGQRKAYHSGMGYRAGREGKAIPFKSEKNKQAFMDGYRKSKGFVSKYPSVK